LQKEKVKIARYHARFITTFIFRLLRSLFACLTNLFFITTDIIKINSKNIQGKHCHKKLVFIFLLYCDTKLVYCKKSFSFILLFLHFPLYIFLFVIWYKTCAKNILNRLVNKPVIWLDCLAPLLLPFFIRYW